MEKITLKSGDAFIIANKHGNLPVLEKETGFFWRGTRFLRICNLLLAEQPPIMLSYTIADEGNSCQIDLMNPALSVDQASELREGTIHIRRVLELQDQQLIQTIIMTSYNTDPVALDVSLEFGADFSNIFEVRGFKRAARGEQFPPIPGDSSLVFKYQGLDDVQRETHVAFSPSIDRFTGETVSWHIALSKDQPIQVRVVVTASEQSSHQPDAHKGYSSIPADHPYTQPLKVAGKEIRTSDQTLNQLLWRGMHDLAMLCTMTPQGVYPYAGIPWFACPFGRDALITSLQFLPWFPEVARGTLAFLAAHQGTKNDLFTEEEPGKILHELRYGELANCREIPFIPYYGSIDVTSLFIITLEAYLRWSNDVAFLTLLWPHAEAAASWMKERGDQDGDTFLESRRTSQKGLVNQGWKDSQDSISHADGRLAEAPIALCEVQAYAYAAYRAMSYLASRLGKVEEATYWSQIAETLQANFLNRYWWEDQSVFYLALDGEKQPCAVVASNAGQCLWTGVVPDDLAQRIIARLLREDMDSRWGIRTLSTREARYNPMSYHNGSIWPHDTAMIGAGFARYGKKDEAGKLLENLSQASLYYERARLPELFCGFTRSSTQGPIPYPVACEPQAWAAGAPFMLLSATLGLEPDAEHNRLTLRQPILPLWLDIIQLQGLHLGEQELSLRIERSNEDTRFVLAHETDIDLQVLI